MSTPPSSSEAGLRATSSDGRLVRLNGAAAMHLPPGDLVVARAPAGDVLVQVVEPGTGQVVRPRRDLPVSRAAFSAVAVRPVDHEDLITLQEETEAHLTIGSWKVGDVIAPARLRARGFGRHTFLCGQSGSGKTYALGVLLEQLVLGTELRMVVLDPNSDFVALDRLRPGVAERSAERMRSAGTQVLGATTTGRAPLRLRYTAMPRVAQAALLRLDPLADRDEYNVFLHVADEGHADEVSALVARLGDGGPAEQALGRRIENLGLVEWEVWAGQDRSLAEAAAQGGRATVADLAGFRDPTESLAVALALVEELWARRAERTPTLLVIDEAHHLCPADARGTVQGALVDRLVQIAAEGRKYGLWLLLSTQRPGKLHPQVLSQCDNLALMRMNSPGDVAVLADVFGFVPPAMLARAPSFVQGEALFAGAFAPVPTFLSMGDRLTPEGGSDVEVPPARG